MPGAVDRSQVLAFRVAAQGLLRDGRSAHTLAVLDIGVQEAMGHPASTAFMARLPESAALPAVGPGHRLALAWSFRGAPHVHRRRDLDAAAAAAYPLSEADAARRLNETGPSVARAGITALDQLATTVGAVGAVVTRAIDKGSASTAITNRLPSAMHRDCRPCGSTHVSDSALRFAALLAGVELEPGTNPPVLLPRPGAATVTQPSPDAVAALARAYLAVLGPAGLGQVADYLGARRADVERCWPADCVEVAVGSARSWVPAGAERLLHNPPEPDAVRLLGPFDPYLQARDRTLLVPDTARHKALWPVLGRPGAVLADGEIVGTWRTRSARGRLTFAVAGFTPLPPTVWDAVEREAALVARARGVADVRIERGD